MTLREKVFENLQHAKENGDFEPGGFLHGETVEQLADDMVAYAADVEDEDPKDLIPHIQAWLDQEGIQIKMTKKQEKFLAGVFGTLLLAAIAVAFGGLTFWLFDHVGPLTSITCLIIAIALFAGFMNASTPDKKEESNEP